ncbi:MAG: HEPN domain-containing protein [Syntrophobacteraceae bacterium]
MIPILELRKIAEARLEDADTLFKSGRYDGAVYLCGYAIEMILKARICETLNWSGYPSAGGEFKDYQSFRTHDLDVLLHLTGREQAIKVDYVSEWSAVSQWSPSARYQAIGTAAMVETGAMIAAAGILLEKI